MLVKKKRLSSIFAVLMVAMLVLSITAPSFAQSTKHPAELLSESFREAISKVKPAVVSISSEKEAKKAEEPRRDMKMDEIPEFFRRFFGDEFFQNPRNFMEPGRQWQGSGVLISEEGDILTNNHVVEGADSISVKLDDGRTIEADMESILTDPGSDIAIFKLKENGKYPYVSLGNSDQLQVGDWVLAIGSPFGLDQTVTQGIVSAKGRTSSDVAIGNEKFFVKDYIQTTAAINPGNSGGPLINLDGEVIGLNNAIQTAGVPGNLGIGFAIPSNLIKQVVDNLKKYGEVKRGYIGVLLTSLEQNNLAKWYKQEYGIEHGALIAQVIPGSPAEEAGLQEQDLIILLNGKKILNRGQLINMVTSYAPGTKIELTILRNGNRITKEVTLAKRPDQEKLVSMSQSLSEKYLGIRVDTLTPELAKQYGFEEDLQGVLIRQVAPGSEAYKVDIRPNDVITQVLQDNTVTSVSEFEKVLSNFIDSMKEKGQENRVFLMHIHRSGQSYPDRWVAPTIKLEADPEE